MRHSGYVCFPLLQGNPPESWPQVLAPSCKALVCLVGHGKLLSHAIHKSFVRYSNTIKFVLMSQNLTNSRQEQNILLLSISIYETL